MAGKRRRSQSLAGPDLRSGLKRLRRGPAGLAAVPRPPWLRLRPLAVRALQALQRVPWQDPASAFGVAFQAHFQRLRALASALPSHQEPSPAVPPSVASPTFSATFASQATSFGGSGGPSSAGPCGSCTVTSTSSSRPRRPSLSARPVCELKAQVLHLGLNSSGCTEKADLVALLRAAASPAAAVGHGLRRAAVQPPPPRPAVEARRPAHAAIASARKSGLRRRSLRHSLLQPTSVTLQRDELQRIMRAKDDLGVLGLRWQDVRSLSQPERQRVVLRRFRELSRRVHPDKCPAELREAATRAFQRLEVAKQHCTGPLSSLAPAAVVQAARTAVAPHWFGWGIY